MQVQMVVAPAAAPEHFVGDILRQDHLAPVNLGQDAAIGEARNMPAAGRRRHNPALRKEGQRIAYR
jgi:hypothetical protein